MKRTKTFICDNSNDVKTLDDAIDQFLIDTGSTLVDITLSTPIIETINHHGCDYHKPMIVCLLIYDDMQ